jgi:fructose transport system substrate-binding protein
MPVKRTATPPRRSPRSKTASPQGAKGILITPSNDSVGPALKDARAAGILVIALDTPLADPEAQDITFATDNFEAGLLIGKWAAAKLGDEAANAKIAMLDINKDNISVDVASATPAS